MKNLSATWYETTVKYESEADGKTSHVTDVYAVDAMSFSEAESQAVESALTYADGEAAAVRMQIAPYTDVFVNEVDGDTTENKFYHVRIAETTIDERTGRERKTTSSILVQADDIDMARRNVREALYGTMTDYDIVSISKTKICEVLPSAKLK